MVLAILILASACSQTKNLQEDTENTLTLFSWMSGSFSSAEQAADNPDYYSIDLHMVPIWVDRGGYWLYVEQAAAESPDAPYRQRVYKIDKVDDFTWESKVKYFPAWAKFDPLEDPDRFIGKWEKPSFFNDFNGDILSEREGCSVFLVRKTKESFKGSTKGKSCQSSLRGASYATSEVEVFYDKIISWDRGFDQDGKQVWGAEKTGYIFKKI